MPSVKTTRACISQALHWDRGRPARREREARANGFEVELFAKLARLTALGAGETPAVPVKRLSHFLP
jgi:hypothetical protein